MSSQSRSILIGCVLLLVAGCGAQAGDACATPEDCPGGVCLTRKEGFRNGYCSSECSEQPCGEKEDCRQVGERSVCLVRCADRSACRTGYQCFEGVCQPACRDDAGCGSRAYVCEIGNCVERPGAKLGEPCVKNDECSSAACIGGRCVQSCERESACGPGRTCVLDRGSDSLRAYCVARRGGAAPLEGCRNDDGCDRGSCVMGACLLLCQGKADCEGAAQARACVGVPAPLSKVPMRKWPMMKACLPRNQNMSVDLSFERNLLMPESARSVLLFTAVPGYDRGYAVGLSSFETAAGDTFYRLWSESNPAGYFANPIRHYPDLGCSSFLFSSSPLRAKVVPGAYPFRVMAEDQSGGTIRPRVQAIYKLYDAPLTQGRLPLRIHITNMSGLPSTCAYRTLTAENGATRLRQMLERLQRIFSQGTVRVTFSPIDFVNSRASSSVDARLENSPNSLGTVLEAASENSGGGVDLVLLRSISPNGVLGIAGGIPASPGIRATPHTGAVAALGLLCYPSFDQDMMGSVIAHELGHTLGLAHNREQDGQSDPLGEEGTRSESYMQNTDNLMYWAEDPSSARLLTAEQGEVVRSMPQVQP